jgi:hypothetical protein
VRASRRDTLAGPATDAPAPAPRRSVASRTAL